MPDPTAQTSNVSRPQINYVSAHKWLLPLLLGLLALIALVALLWQCGGDNDAADLGAGTPASATAVAISQAAASSPTSSSLTGEAQTGTGQAGGLATVTAAGRNLLDTASAAALRTRNRPSAAR